MKTEKKIQEFIAERSLLSNEDKLLVALSGGADSVCLLLTLIRLGYECVAAHCNFHLRGEESIRDEQFVRSLCERMSIKLCTADFDTATYARQHRQSIELAARELRYTFFNEAMQAEGCTKLAVGHHKDDNAETFLLNAVRKTGVRGLCGIKPLSVNSQGCTVVRPLLCLTRQEIEDYLTESGEAWVIDSTNLQEEAARNRIRLHVVPALKTVNKAAVDNLCTTMQNLTEVMKIYDAEMQRCIQRCTHWEGDTLYINREKLSACTSPISVLHETLSPLGFNETQIQNLLTAKGYRCNRPKGPYPIWLPTRQISVQIEVSWKVIKIFNLATEKVIIK
ncbi:MAG: tRNA lysidine(34) synthetase TilS [Bacteroidaceae bacterium]|nr:tRNA lysidine(34) synthetase TilS [Bacteroidaceae bacterium]